MRYLTAALDDLMALVLGIALRPFVTLDVCFDPASRVARHVWRRRRTGDDVFGTTVTAPRFAGDSPAVVLSTEAGVVFEVDTTKRTVAGLILPWDTEARSAGRTWSFPPGSVTYSSDPSRVKLWLQHDPNRAVGFATALDVTFTGAST